jgi:hypothetical protein
MKDLILDLYQLGLTTTQVRQTLFTIDQWLEEFYPSLSQMYQKQLLEQLLQIKTSVLANKKRGIRVSV